MPLLHENDPYWPKTQIKEALLLADAVIANTTWERGRLITEYGVSERKAFVGGTGVETKRPAGIAQQHQFTVTYLGRRSLSKGIRTLIEAMSIAWEAAPDMRLNLIGARGTDEDAILKLLGDLPEEKRSKVFSRCDVTEAEKQRALEDTSVLVLPSMIESFGAVILEAWSFAIPVIAFDLPAIRCTVDHGRDGLLIPPDASDLARCILRLRGRPELLDRMGTAGYQKVKEMFTWQEVTRRFLAAYTHAIASV